MVLNYLIKRCGTPERTKSLDHFSQLHIKICKKSKAFGKKQEVRMYIKLADKTSQHIIISEATKNGCSVLYSNLHHKISVKEHILFLPDRNR